MCTARRSWCFALTVFGPVLWRSSQGVWVLCVCELHLNGEKVVGISDLIVEPDWSSRHQGVSFFSLTLAIDEFLFLCVLGGRKVGGDVGTLCFLMFRRAAVLYRVLLHLVGSARLAMARWQACGGNGKDHFGGWVDGWMDGWIAGSARGCV